MSTAAPFAKKLLPALLVLALLAAGCDLAASYRPADKKTINDFPLGHDYRKQVGVLALANTTLFSGPQVAVPLMTTFLSSMSAAAPDALLVVPEMADVPPFLSNPPRLADGDVDAFALAGLARQRGMNAVVRPVLMDIRVRKRDTGFWIFKDVAYSLQIRTTAVIYDAVTGARLDMDILTDEVDIDEYQAENIEAGKEVEVDDLADAAEKMGEELGERMGQAIRESKWLASVVALTEDACVIMAGSEVGLKAGDRFSILDGSQVLPGQDGQRFIVPGPEIGFITVSRVSPRQALATPESGPLPPAGSIVVPSE